MVRSNPWPFYEWLHRKCESGVYRIPSSDNCYVVSRYDEVREVLTDPDTYSSQIFRSQKVPMILLMDGKEHRRIRETIQSLFTPSAINAMEQTIRRIVDRYTTQLLQAGRCDLMNLWATPIPLHVIALLLGLDDEERDLRALRTQAAAINRAFFPLGGLGEKASTANSATHIPAVLNEVRKCRGKLLEIVKLLGPRATFELAKSIPLGRTKADEPHPNYSAFPEAVAPATDLVVSLCRRTRQSSRGAQTRDRHVLDLFTLAEQDGRITASEQIFASIMILIAGFDTTAALLAHMFVHLAQHPSRFRDLREHPEKLDGFIEETLRLYPSLGKTLRRVTKNTHLGGQFLPKNSQIMLLIGAANADERKYLDAFQFDPERSHARSHLSFGKGPHVCLGAPLARLEAKLALQALLTRAESIEIDPEVDPEFVVHRDASLYSYETLRVIVE